MSIIDNIIKNHTEYDIEEYTGASLQAVLTHKGTQKVFKLTLFFGYNKQKNSIYQTIEITENQYLTLSAAILEKNNAVIKQHDSLLSDDELFGSSLRLRNDPIYTNTNTINTNTTNTNILKIGKFIEDGYQKKVLDELIEHRKMLKKPLKTQRMMSGLINSLERYAEHWSITFDDAVEFYLSQSWIGIDVEYKYSGRKVKKEDQELSFSDIGKRLRDEKNKIIKLGG